MGRMRHFRVKDRRWMGGEAELEDISVLDYNYHGSLRMIAIPCLMEVYGLAQDCCDINRSSSNCGTVSHCPSRELRSLAPA
ncbi:unnamed protein product [Lota lota]